MRLFAVAVALALTGVTAVVARPQDGPVNGMRPSELRLHAIVNATVVPAPGERLEGATIVVRDGVIDAVGTDLVPPAGARVHDADGAVVYAGFIDAALPVEVETGRDLAVEGGGHWNTRVHPQLSIIDQPALEADLRKAMRELGFTAALVVPANGIFRGSGAVMAMAEEPKHVVAYREQGPMAMSLEYGRGRSGSAYPGALNGSMALVRQTLHDAAWHRDCRAVYAADPAGHEPPRRADALLALEPVVNGVQPVLFDVRDEHHALRAARIMDEFGVEGMLLGSGLEFRRLEEIAALGRPVIVPLEFPDAPDVSTPHTADQATLQTLLNWEQAPAGPRRLIEAGVPVALTTHRLDRRNDFHKALARAAREGLTEEMALAALTTTPARLLGIERTLGTVAPGKVANLVVMTAPLLDSSAKVTSVWVGGRRHEIVAPTRFALAGTGEIRLGDADPLEVSIDPEASRLEVTPPPGAEKDDEAPDGEEANEAPADDDSDDEGKDTPAGPKPVRASKTTFTRDGLSAVISGDPFGIDGTLRLSGVLVEGEIIGDAVAADGVRRPFVIAGVTVAPEDPDEADDATSADDDAESSAPDSDAAPAAVVAISPMTAYGRGAPPRQQDVLLRDVTIWTSGPEGVIDSGWMLVRDGRVAALGAGDPPAGAADEEGLLVLDLPGRHVTPGLIDCHSHTGIHGGVNESTQANTAEVRIADVINPDDVNWYRQLAGGLTAANQLHGSANPIGGQNSVVKLKWGSPASAFPIEDAIPGIKFALGENVVRSQSRYPNTRMGVETFMTDAFTAAERYRDQWRAYESLSDSERAVTMPPRRDLEMDTLVEILEGRRLVHCHSYRQDEILMLLRLAERFGFTIGTLQHILEGYKVGESIASHGAGASSFSDWWAYKMEVMDAIPYNGAILHDLGVVVSFNSDSSELARRMNNEASKAVRYGDLEPEVALAFVTINPARQLRIDHRTGSLEPGKDADFAVWSGHPLSTYSRCEQTWIEGARYFDAEADLAMRESTAAERTRLLAKAADGGGSASGSRGRGRGGRSGGSPASRSRPSERGGLLARLLDERTDRLLAMVRRGEDPEEIRPGECGCNILDLTWLEGASK